ncbi:hypothetical protein ELG78_09135 [Rhizobium leguminosarum]|uniref:hypothetical protein n=1 Tax=Rhizobium leguminosarum TaxID=384 RepID=UPI001031B03B|nr:hypothetical protein [Rhizobium leguminosarum]TBG37132.1 hypothetical protein ELG78_09135 [Rhizobium leguminosarum]
MTLTELRDEWIAAENIRTEAYRAFMDANRNSPLRIELDKAERAEKAAKEAYAKALRGEDQQQEIPPTWNSSEDSNR